MDNKGSSFADFVRFRPHTYARTQQSLPPLWPAVSIIRQMTFQILLLLTHLYL